MVFKLMVLSVSAFLFGADHLMATEGGVTEKARVKVLSVLGCDQNDHTCTYEVQHVLSGDELGDVAALVFPQREEVGDRPLLTPGLIVDLALNSSIDEEGKMALRGYRLLNKVGGEFDEEISEVRVKALSKASCEAANRATKLKVCQQVVATIATEEAPSRKLVLTSFYESPAPGAVHTKLSLRVGSTYRAVVRAVGQPYGDEHKFVIAAWADSAK